MPSLRLVDVERFNRSRRMLLILGRAVLAVALATTALGFAGGWWWPLDLMAHFRLGYVLGLALAALLLAAVGSWRLLALAVGGLVVNLVLILPFYAARPAPIASESATLRLIAFNVSQNNERIGEVLSMLETSGADLIFLFEGGSRWEEAINGADLPYALSPGAGSAFGFGNAVLVREGLEVDIRGVRVGPKTPQPRTFDVPLGDLTIRVLALHPPSPTSGDKARTRDEQLAGLAEWSAQQDVPVLVVGDLNASPWSYAYRPLAESDLVNSLEGFGLQATWPAALGFLGTPIDHVLHSPELTTVNRQVGPSLGSEHRSVFVTIAKAAG